MLTDDFFIPLPADEQTVAEGKRIVFSVQIPPLPLPVSASTPGDILHTQGTLENVSHLDTTLQRVAWVQIMFPADVLNSERWSGVSVIADGPEKGLALYESYEVFNGALASTVQALYGDDLQESFEAQATAHACIIAPVPWCHYKFCTNPATCCLSPRACAGRGVCIQETASPGISSDSSSALFETGSVSTSHILRFMGIQIHDWSYFVKEDMCYLLPKCIIENIVVILPPTRLHVTWRGNCARLHTASRVHGHNLHRSN